MEILVIKDVHLTNISITEAENVKIVTVHVKLVQAQILINVQDVNHQE